MDLTIVGAAMNKTTSACITNTISIGVVVLACIVNPPALSAPNKRAAKTVPSGFALPNNATVIASKPKDPAIPAVSAYSLPSTCTAHLNQLAHHK